MTSQEIKARLKQKRVTQAALARKWGKSPATIHFLIERKLTSEALERKLARLLGVSIESLKENGETEHAGTLS